MDITIGTTYTKQYGPRDFGAAELLPHALRVTVLAQNTPGRFARMTGKTFHVREETIRDGVVVATAETDWREDRLVAFASQGA